MPLFSIPPKYDERGHRTGLKKVLDRKPTDPHTVTDRKGPKKGKNRPFCKIRLVNCLEIQSGSNFCCVYIIIQIFDFFKILVDSGVGVGWTCSARGEVA